MKRRTESWEGNIKSREMGVQERHYTNAMCMQSAKGKLILRSKKENVQGTENDFPLEERRKGE